VCPWWCTGPRSTRLSSSAPHDLAAFKAKRDVIVANHWSDELADVAAKVHTRDLCKRD
jgi:UDPglucose 6-dehydrogenase